MPPVERADRSVVTRRLCMRVWLLAEGSVLPGGATVLSVQRDPMAYRVSVATDDGLRWTLPGDVQVAVAQRADPLAHGMSALSSAAFRSGARRRRRDRRTGG